MAIINQRWPSNLCPTTCEFGRSRNNVRQTSPRTRRQTIIAQGRPLWTAKLTWRFPNDEKAHALRYWLDGLEAGIGSVQIWDFALPRPENLLFQSGGVPKLHWINIAQNYDFISWSGVPSHWVSGATVSLHTAVAAGATAVTLAGLQPSTVAALQGGHLQIGRRLYLVASDAVANAAGVATVTLTTPVIEANAPGAPARVAEAACEMFMVNDDWSGGRNATGLYSASAEFRETSENYAWP